MPKYVVVTRAQKAAARAMVERSAVTGRDVSPSVRKIAEAQRVPDVRSDPKPGARASN